jgi:hypothetical protein
MKQPPRAYGRLFALHSARTTVSIPGADSNVTHRHLYAPWLLRPLTLKLPSTLAQLPPVKAVANIALGSQTPPWARKLRKRRALLFPCCELVVAP